MDGVVRYVFFFSISSASSFILYLHRDVAWINEKRFVAAIGQTQLRIYKTQETNLAPTSITAHTDYVREIAVLQQARKCLSGGYDRHLNVVDLSTLQVELSIETGATISSIRTLDQQHLVSYTQQRSGILILADLRIPHQPAFSTFKHNTASNVRSSPTNITFAHNENRRRNFFFRMNPLPIVMNTVSDTAMAPL